MSISFGGIGEVAVTFMTSGDVKKGNVVKVTGNGTVAVCGASDRFCGVVLNVSDDGYATVQLRGYMKAKYSGTEPAVGFNVATAGGADNVTVSADGEGGEILVLDIDKTDKVIGFYM